jgi:hypothetical protein
MGWPTAPAALSTQASGLLGGRLRVVDDRNMRGDDSPALGQPDPGLALAADLPQSRPNVVIRTLRSERISPTGARPERKRQIAS